MANETKTPTKRNGLNARAWFAATSFHNHAPAAEPKPAKQPVEIWDGAKWITVLAEVK